MKMLGANHTITIIYIIETFIFLNFVKIMLAETDAAVAAAAPKSQLIIDNNGLISRNNYVTADRDVTDGDHRDNELIRYITDLFCDLNSNPVYTYIDQAMRFDRFLQNLVVQIHGCMRSTFLMKSINFTLPYANQELTTNNKENYTLFLVINNLAERYRRQFDFISKLTANKNKKKFIVLITSPNHTTHSIDHLFREFHRKLIYNVVVIARNETTNYDVLTYNPFHDINYLEYFNKTEHRPDKLFYNKIVAHADQRIKLKVVVFEERSRMVPMANNPMRHTGIDGFMMHTVMAKMNADYEINRPRDNKTYGAIINGSLYGSLKDVHEWHDDIAFNSRFLKPNEFLFIVEPTVVVGRDDLCLLVPNMGNESHIANLVHSFSYIIWILIILMIFVVSCTIYVTQKITKNPSHQQMKHILLAIFKTNLNQSLRKPPRTFQMRIVLISWFFYCILITNSFIANLTSVLILERELPQIDTLHELAESKLHILSVLRYKYEIVRNLNFSKKSHVLVANRIRIVDEKELEGFVHNNSVQYAYVEKDHVIKYIMESRAHLIHGRLVYHEMQQCPVPNLITYITPIGSPYLDRINYIIRQLIESGLYGWWSKNIEMERRRSNKQRRFVKNSEHSTQFKDLALSHLQLVFYMLGLGLSLATVVFLVELQQHSKDSIKNKSKPYDGGGGYLSKFLKRIEHTIKFDNTYWTKCTHKANNKPKC